MICVRGSGSATLQIVRNAKKNGKYVISFLDDDLLNIPDNISCTDYYQDKIIQRNIKDILKHSDVLWVVNTKIGEKYSQYCSNWVLEKIPANIEYGNDSILKGSLVKFLYAGSKDHEQNVRKYLIPAVRRICSDYEGSVEFSFVGVNSGIENMSNVKNYVYFKDYNYYREFIQKEQFQYGLAVIETTDFYQAKYYNKYIEYGSLGIVGIYTKSMPYVAIVRDTINGYLTENNEEAWYKSIKKVFL